MTHETPTKYTLCVWHGDELSFLTESTDLHGLVKYASKLIHDAKLAGKTDVSANIAPKGVES